MVEFRYVGVSPCIHAVRVELTVSIYIHQHCPRLDIISMHTRVWYHGANTARQIGETFAPLSVYNAIEVDISSMHGILRLAHGPKARTVDTTLANFLDIVKTVPTEYTIKFDFKDEVSIRTGIPLIKQAQLDTIATQHTLVANVDTIPGPGGVSHVIMNSTEFINLIRQELPSYLISIGMTTGWHVKTLFFSHAYTAHHIDKLMELDNCTFAMRMVILSQTNPAVLDRISGADFLVWGERGVFETMWLRNGRQFNIDEDLGRVGVWLLITYTWVVLWAIIIIGVLCYVTTRILWSRHPADAGLPDSCNYSEIPAAGESRFKREGVY